MSVEAHIKSLQSKHADLKEMLAKEVSRPSPDFYVIKDIKKQKLVIKEEIARLVVSPDMKHQNAS